MQVILLDKIGNLGGLATKLTLKLATLVTSLSHRVKLLWLLKLT